MLTISPLIREFPDPNVAGRFLFRPLVCTVVACFNTQTHEPEAIEAIDIHGAVKVTQAAVRGSRTVQSSMLPYVPSSRVSAPHSGSLGLWFQGSHKTKIEEDRLSVTRYAISPVYTCKDRSGTSHLVKIPD